MYSRASSLGHLGGYTFLRPVLHLCNHRKLTVKMRRYFTKIFPTIPSPSYDKVAGPIAGLFRRFCKHVKNSADNSHGTLPTSPLCSNDRALKLLFDIIPGFFRYVFDETHLTSSNKLFACGKLDVFANFPPDCHTQSLVSYEF